MPVYIIDDDPHILDLVSKCLKWQGHSILAFSSPAKALKDLKAGTPDLVILDIDMPKINGFKVLQELRKRKQYIPVIFLTGRSDCLELIEGLDSGADDYLTKPFDVRELMARVAAQWRIQSMRTDLEQANKILKKLSITDALTDLLIMDQAYKKIEAIFKKHNKLKSPATIKEGYGFCMLDLDHFKSVNDGNSHLFGSFVLAEFAKLLKKSLPNKKSFAARYGGDEFCAVIYGTQKQTQDWAKAFKKQISEYCFVQKESKIQLSTSLGLSFVTQKILQSLQTTPKMTSQPTPTLTPEQFAKQVLLFADKALYKSKNNGRNKLSTKTLDLNHFSFGI